MNCINDDCKYLYQDYHGDELHCLLTYSVIPDNIEETQCKNFVQAKTCINCKHATIQIYETDRIDSIEYRCPFQNNKLMYDDTNPYNFHYMDVPECNIDKFES